MKKISEIKYWMEMINKVIQGDCIEVMKVIPDNAVNFIFADPPYNAKNIGPNNRVYKGQKMKLDDDEYRKFCQDWFREAIRISERILLTPGIANISLYPQPTWIIAWHKPTAVSFNRMGGFNVWEPIFFYGKMPSGKRLGHDHVLCHTRNLGRPIEKEHPCPKPLELMRILIDNFTDQNDLVLDPFAGSGTTLRACKDFGRQYIGIELIDDYCEISEKRLQQETIFNFPE